VMKSSKLKKSGESKKGKKNKKGNHKGGKRMTKIKTIRFQCSRNWRRKTV
jgi:hypothetical protein